MSGQGRHGFFAYEGRRLHYEVLGEGERMLVYLHGLLLDGDLNRGIATALSERGHRVVLLDLLGHGRSDKPADPTCYRMDAYARQVVAFLDHVGAAEAAVGGISFGANVSLQTAALAPDRVRALVVEMPVLENAASAAALTFLPLALAARHLPFAVRLVTGSAARLPRTSFPPVDSFLNAFSNRPATIESVLYGLLFGPLAPSVAERRALRVPTLVLAHDYDLIHPFSDATALVEQMPAARLLRAHSMVELRLWPDRLTREIAEFLEEVWSSAELSA